MASLNQIEYIVGIDLGTTSSKVSIAHVNDPFNIITVLSWDDLKESSKYFLSSVLYLKDENNTPLCGIEHDDVNDRGVYVANITQYLVDIDASNEKLSQLMDGLTVKKVMIDYLKYFIPLALKRLQVQDKLIKNERFQDFVNENFIDENIKTVCYCLVCPTDRQEFMKDCFIEAGIIEASEAEHRLSFVIQAVAIAHYQLSRDRKETGIENDQYYFVLDISDISIGIARIHAASTELLSTVTGISDDIRQGLLNLGIKFKDYLIENMTALKLDNLLIDQLVRTFSEKMKKYKFDMYTPTQTVISHNDIDGNPIEFTYEDLDRIVLKPFIESIAEFVSKADEAHGHCKIFFVETYDVNAPYFIENLLARDEGKLKYRHSIIEDSFGMVSSSAVSSRLNTCKSQTPFSLNDNQQSQCLGRKWSLPETVPSESTDDDNNGNGACDLIVGLGLSLLKNLWEFTSFCCDCCD
ncbi:uncharacterized protein EV154DRAFT_548819 [Mucor mucedo]|uniref:uncharacterized protein n=1 Tax=Mucor mucedo TaxID=29922 RepID=UPI00221EB1C8|nr:uncharacterized protein EV154DRAFT_548819 [Mucor mucedo]KAI7894667.1 hypothetical protein EV154DRAFT_548819 [Mucor mucedo]